MLGHEKFEIAAEPILPCHTLVRNGAIFVLLNRGHILKSVRGMASFLRLLESGAFYNLQTVNSHF